MDGFDLVVCIVWGGGGGSRETQRSTKKLRPTKNRKDNGGNHRTGKKGGKGWVAFPPK